MSTPTPTPAEAFREAAKEIAVAMVIQICGANADTDDDDIAVVATRLAPLQRRLEEAEKIVADLPKTSDGAPVYPGVAIFLPCGTKFVYPLSTVDCWCKRCRDPGCPDVRASPSVHAIERCTAAVPPSPEKQS